MHELFKKARFVKAARDKCKEPNKAYTFRCTICGCPAKAMISKKTGKVNARCPECGYIGME